MYNTYDVSDIISFIFPDASFPGYIQFWAKDRGGNISHFLKSVKVGTEYRLQATEHDLYMTKDLMASPKKRTKKDTFAFNAIAVDLDAHDISDIELKLACDRMRDVFTLNDKIMPNLTVRTGRGMQIFFLLSPIHTSFVAKYEKTERALFDYIQTLIDKNKLPFKVDRSACGAGHLFRVPGSYHAGRRCWSTYAIRRRERYTLQELFELLGCKWGKKKPRKEPAKKIRFKDNYAPLHWKRKLFIEELVNNRSSMIGYRNTALFLYASSVFEVSASPYDDVMELGRKMGLKHSECESVARHYSKIQKWDHAKNKTFFALLNLSPEEIVRYHSINQRTAKSEEGKRRKAERDALIIKYYELGYNKRMIAESVGCSPTTLYKVLAAYGLHDAKEKAVALVEKVIKAGKNGLKAACQFFEMLTELDRVGEVSFDPAEIELPLMDVLELLTVRGSPPLALTG